MLQTLGGGDRWPQGDGLILLIPVLLSSAVGGWQAGVPVSLLAIVLWDVYFVAPTGTFVLEPPRFIVAQLVFVIVAALVGTLSISQRRRERERTTKAERARVSRDLHDSTTQSLYGITLISEAAARLVREGDAEGALRHLQEVTAMARETLQDMRVSVHDLRPREIVAEGGLGPAIEAQVHQVARMMPDLALTSAIDRVVRLPDDVEDLIYRVAQESLTNVLRHAHAHALEVSLNAHQDRIRLCVRDDGVGFDSRAVSSGSGIAGMKERVTQAGGRLEVRGSPGAGTRVVLDMTV